jgi:hypothetical protein
MGEMRRVSGTLNGTGAALVVGLGFRPDWIRLWNLEATNPVQVEWNRDMRSAEQEEGIGTVSDGTQNLYARYTHGNGIAPYRGKDIVAASNTTYLVTTKGSDQKNTDFKGSITDWTLGSSSNRTGNFNVAVDTTYVGEGSKVIAQVAPSGEVYEVFITALTDTGESANEVTLTEAVPNGAKVRYIGPMYDYIAAAAEVVMPAGFKINMTSGLNASGNIIQFEAGTYH